MKVVFQYSADGRFYWNGVEWVPVPHLKRVTRGIKRAMHGVLIAALVVAIIFAAGVLMAGMLRG